MIAKAASKYIRMSPRKVRQVADLVRGKGINEAFAILTSLHKKAGVYIDELLKSALANAKQKQSELDIRNVFISKFTVDGGPQLVRYRAASMGRATLIRHRTSHLMVELDLKEKTQKKAAKEAKKKKSGKE